MKLDMPQAKSLEEVDKAEAEGYLYVHAICPKCGEGWTSLTPNARKIIEKGCVVCTMDTDDEWQPKAGVCVVKI